MDQAPPYFSALFDPEITDYYAWTIPKEDMFLVGAALPPGKDAPARFDLLKRKLAARGFPLTRRIKREGVSLMTLITLITRISAD